MTLPARAAEPVDISAAKSLEWNRAAKTYTALGDVRVRRGAAEIKADRLTAAYAGTSGTDIRTLTAQGGVTVSAPPYTAYGDRAVYDVATGDATLTGGDLRVETENARLTARDSLVYAKSDNRLSARGGATVVKDGRTLKAEKLDAFFVPGPGGDLVTQRITAEGGVSVETGRETVTGAAGTYDLAAGQAELTGGVRIAQGGSFLEGSRATVDMKTGISKLYGGKAAKGRVRGVFYPKKGATP